MIRKTLVLVSFFVLGCFSVQAQTPQTPQTASFWSCPSRVAGQTLRIYNWTTYIAEDTIANFERICDVQVIYNTYASDNDMLDELRQGNSSHDLVVPSNANAYLMIDERLVQSLSRISLNNLDNIGSQFLNPPYDPTGQYTVPYQWGTIAVGYNRSILGRDITSWNDVFNGNARVAWIDENRAMLGFALLMLGFDPNTDNPTQVDAAAQYLIDHSANVTVIAPDTGQDLLAAGQVDIVVEYSGDIFQIIGDCSCDDFRYVIPQEGAQIWTDNMVIPMGAFNPSLARIFIDYVLVPQVGADISNYTAYGSPNQSAIDQGLISEHYLTNPGIYPPPETMDNLFYNVSNADLETLYTTAWERVRAAVGR